MSNDEVIDLTIELFGAFMGQEIATSPLTPKKTGRMRSTFVNTMQVIDGPKGKIIRYTTPFYTKFVNNGTSRIRARKFIQQVFHQKARENMKKAFRIASKRVNG